MAWAMVQRTGSVRGARDPRAETFRVLAFLDTIRAERLSRWPGARPVASGAGGELPGGLGRDPERSSSVVAARGDGEKQ